MSPSWAPKPDGVSAYHLKQLHPQLIQEIFISTAEQREIPKESNSSEIVPIFKPGDPLDPSNYRPISLINTLVKLYELTILRTIPDREQIIATAQYGAIRGKSAPLQYEQLASSIEDHLRRQQDSWIQQVDFSTAFDSVNRQIMIAKLAAAGIPAPIIDAIILTQTNQ